MNNTTIELSDTEYVDSIGDAALYDVLMGNIPRNILLVAHELGLFEIIGNSSLSKDEIGSQLGIADRPVSAMLSVLRTNGFLDLLADQYCLSPVAQKYLLKESPYYYGRVIERVKMIGEQGLTSPENLKRLIVHGEQKFQGFNTFEEDPENTASFIAGMHAYSMPASRWWVEKLDLSGRIRLLDIGGGSGAHAIAAMQKWPDLEAVVLDMAPVCKVTQKYFEQSGVAERGKTLEYDLWKSEMPSAEVHFYSNIFHDWSYEQGRFLAQKSFDALEQGGRIVIHEMLYHDDKSGPKTIAHCNVGMLMTMEGQQYSGQELVDVLEGVGFQDIQVIPTKAYWSMVVGVKY